ncbi:MAG TPA: hypothetical protein VFS02_22320 [Telluria sp.]|nr:hypothetical protein [Telluria sp.]
MGGGAKYRKGGPRIGSGRQIARPGKAGVVDNVPPAADGAAFNVECKHGQLLPAQNGRDAQFLNGTRANVVNVRAVTYLPAARPAETVLHAADRTARRDIPAAGEGAARDLIRAVHICHFDVSHSSFTPSRFARGDNPAGRHEGKGADVVHELHDTGRYFAD